MREEDVNLETYREILRDGCNVRKSKQKRNFEEGLGQSFKEKEKGETGNR